MPTERAIGFALVTVEGKTAPIRVILGDADDDKLLSVVVLEQLGFILDPLKRKLIPVSLRGQRRV